jgi:hypothetical protein
METLEQMKERQAKERAKLEAEHAIANLAPVPPRAVMLTACGERAWISYEADSLWAALDVMAKFQPVAFYKFKGTYTRYEPEAINDKRTRDKGESDDVPLVALIDTSGGEGFGPNALLCFFAYLGDDLCKVKIELKPEGYGPALWWQYAAQFIANARGTSRRLDGNRYILGDFRANETLAGMSDCYTKWGSGSREAWHFTYALCADYANSDYSAAWTDAGLRLENIAGALHGPRPRYRFKFDSNAMTGRIIRLEDGKESAELDKDSAWKLYNATRYGGRDELDAAGDAVEWGE